ncbi:hypothetical protein [Streptomyces sp. NPDC005805]|uniref:hypothetical protein n=1 Tax=Streptomyces sp. NPDC005805 TaxID=3157068 RepID=UPI0033F7976A
MRKTLAACVASAAVLASLGAPVAATAAPVGDDAGVQAVVERAMAGTASAADLAVIAKDDRLARTVPVRFEKGEPVTRLVAPPSAAAGKQAAVASAVPAAASASFQKRCLSTDYPVTALSWLGDTLYTWHHTVSWCTANQVNGVESTRVISGPLYNRSDYLTNKSSVAYQRDLATDAQFAPDGSPIAAYADGTNSPYFSHRARTVELCVLQYGCYANNLPQSKLTLGTNGARVAFSAAL